MITTAGFDPIQTFGSIDGDNSLLVIAISIGWGRAAVGLITPYRRSPSVRPA
jgi:hypothetical protein